MAWIPYALDTVTRGTNRTYIRATMLSWNKEALPGFIFGLIGTVVCWAVWGPLEAGVFFLGATLGSIRLS